MSPVSIGLPGARGATANKSSTAFLRWSHPGIDMSTSKKKKLRGSKYLPAATSSRAVCTGALGLMNVAIDAVASVAVDLTMMLACIPVCKRSKWNY